MKIWQIPEGGLQESLNEPIVDLVYHQRRVGLIEWHPTASNILLSSGKSIEVIIFSLVGSCMIELELYDHSQNEDSTLINN